MRHQSEEYLKNVIEQNGPFHNVLDVGSAHINGDVRHLFKTKYTGLDMRSGPNVDVVCNAHDMKKWFGDQTFDLVVCFDMLEHDDKFWLSVENMKSVLRQNGWLVIGVPGQNTPPHDHPNDFWRFMKSSVSTWFEGFENVEIEEQKDDPDHQFIDEIYGRGRKP